MARWLCVFLLLFATPSEAARIWSTTEKVPSNGLTLAVLYLDGDIAPGDAKTFETVARGFLKEGYAEVRLNSLGGDLAEAMDIASIIRNAFFSTFVEAGRECASACVFVLSGGVYRTIEDGAIVELHRPRFPAAKFAAMTPADARKFYGDMVEVVHAFWINDMGMSDAAWRLIMATGSDTVYTVRGRDEAIALGLDGEDPAWGEYVRARKVAQRK